MKRYKFLAGPYLVWAGIFVLIPIAMVFYYAFSSQDGGISFENFSYFFAGRGLLTLWRSVRIALITTLICLVLAYPAAYFMARSGSKKSAVLMMLTVIPMWMNFLLRTYAWITILSRQGLLNSFLALFGLGPTDLLYTEAAVILGMVYNFLPFMILPIYTSLEEMDNSLLEAAADLGADKRQSFLQISLPLSIPGVISGISMVFIPAISTFEISSLLGGNKTNLIGNVIEQQFTVAGNWHYGSAMATVLMIFLIISLFISPDKGAETKSMGLASAESEIDREKEEDY